VSYYDYYQPEAYIPQSDTYIEKDALINDEIDRMRHSATKSLLERRDVLVVASVSCIYGIGEPDTYQGLHLELGESERIDRDEIIRRLVAVQYERNDYDFHRGTFRVRGDVIEVFPANEESIALRVELFGDVIDAISRIDPLRGAVLERVDRVHIYPASHYVTEAAQLERAFVTIQEELGERLTFLRQKNRLLEAQRLEQRTIFDMEMLRELGFCHGIENYSRHLTGHRPGEAPPTLIDYLPKDALIIIDESHVAVPQIRGMYYGDRSRKEALVEYGFRMPSAFDNRPLTFDEFTRRTGQTIYVSATPSAYELELAGDALAEQVIRPTGLTDPRITVRPAKDQVDDLLAELRARADRDERVLVTTLTKRMAEDLTEYYQQLGLRVRYLHSDIDTLDRVAVIRDLRLGKFDGLIGINLLREGLDIPRCRWWRSWTPTRKAICARRPPSSRPPDGRRATSTARSSCTPTASRTRWRRRSRRPSGGGSCSTPTIRRTASRRNRSSPRSVSSFRRFTSATTTRCRSKSRRLRRSSRRRRSRRASASSRRG